jgi:low affinity Fe/Cu permease
MCKFLDMKKLNEFFRVFAQKTSDAVGSPWAFLLAFLAIIIWGVSGPLFGYSQTWQLVINTGTTIVTFLMVFVVQNTQNREAKATQIKLDDLIEAQKKAHKRLVGIEEQSDEQLERAKKKIEGKKGRKSQN